LTVHQKVEREDLVKRMLEILAKHAISNFHFLLLGMSRSCSTHITFGRCGHSVQRTLTKLNVPTIEHRNQCSQSFLTAMVCISLIFCLRIKR
jgi:hypothetical protein